MILSLSRKARDNEGTTKDKKEKPSHCKGQREGKKIRSMSIKFLKNA
jgi:hypothetical protein